MHRNLADPAARLRRSRRLNLVLAGAVAGMAAFLALTWGPRGAAPEAGNQALLDPAVREATVQRLVDESTGLWDSFPDPDVGRVMLPDKVRGMVRSNHLGLRERDFPLDKPAGTLRVVLLGDSFVFGAGLPAEERVGVHLESLLRASATAPVDLEVLHVGLSSWNIQAECAFLHRTLDLLRPDLVLHVVVANDLDDINDIRGFGEMARNVSSQQRARANGLVRTEHGTLHMKTGQLNWITQGLDHESRQRYAEAAGRLADLAREVEASGGRYQLVNYWKYWVMPQARELLCAGLREDQVMHLASPEFRDRDFELSPTDVHWNGPGCLRVARFLMGGIQDRHLLPALALTETPALVGFFRRTHEDGGRAGPGALPAAQVTVGPAVDLTRFDLQEWRQVHGGIDHQGLVAPYASLVLRRGEATELVVQGTALDRDVLRGARITVFADEFEVGVLEIEPGAALGLRVPLPEAVRERDYLSVRFTASDYVYAPDDLRQCVAWRLEQVRVE